MENRWIEFKVFGDALCVTEVLPEWILEWILLAVEGLNPLGLVFRSKNPSLQVLRLNHEQAKWRN
jgi:hypothetical protein